MNERRYAELRTGRALHGARGLKLYCYWVLERDGRVAPFTGRVD